MILDFSKLGGSSNQIQTEPRKIFSTLVRASRFKRPLDEQSDVLDDWYLQRKSKDLTIKMNTGGGKTIVGLLCLQSSLNENIRPAIYITPDKYLTHQVIKEAQDLGIAVTNDENDSDFISGKSILVTNIYKVFNGKSVFGIDEVKVPIGAVVIDDAHACLDTINEQFTIKISEQSIFKELLDIFEDDLNTQSASRLLDIKDGDRSVIAPVPYWAWQSKQAEVLEILHSHRNSPELMFKWPLIKDSLSRCNCIFSGKEIEITPFFLPINKIPSFNDAQRRIYMTATLADDTILVTHLKADPKSIQAPIIPKNGGDIGDRMILLPQEINPNFELDDLKLLLKDLSGEKNVVVIVPSQYQAENWKDVATKILDRNNLIEGVESLKNGHVGLVVLVNKYDGIDLPGKACEVLVIFELPEVYSLKSRYEMQVLDGTKRQLVQQIQRVEQGMGRGVRSSDDYCVVFLLGHRLTQRLHQPESESIFSAATQAQIELGKKITQQIRGKSIHDLKKVLDYCLDRNEEWIFTSRSAVVDAVQVEKGELDESQVSLRQAFDYSEMNQHFKSTEKIQLRLNSNTEEPRMQGYLKQQLATYTNFIDPVQAQEIQKSALASNYSLFRTLNGIQYTKLSLSNTGQAIRSLEYMKRFVTGNELIVWINAVISDLNWGNTGSQTEKFERAIEEVGSFLGFGSQQPEENTGRGPDNLWMLGGLSYLVIECKSGAVLGDSISKHDTNQLNGSMNWFKEKYDDSCIATPIMIHPKLNFHYAAVPDERIRLIGKDQLLSLKTNLRAYAEALANAEAYADKVKISQLQKEFKFEASLIISAYSVDRLGK